MKVQDMFYLLGSVYLVLGIIVLLVVLVAVIYIMWKLNKIHDQISKRIEQEIQEIKEKPRLLASYIGHVIAKGIKNRMRS